MEKKAILVVSFGTTKDETRKKNIEVLEEEIRECYPDYTVRRAFTSSVVIRRLAKRGILVDTAEQALEKLKREGFCQVFVLATHLLPGEEYEKLLRQVSVFETAFARLTVAKPLLYHTDDLLEVAELVRENYPLEDNEALLLMGHGTPHFSNCIYPAMAYILRDQGASRAFVATVKGYPKLNDVLSGIEAEGYEGIALAPLMLVAGEHAMEEMAGDAPDSWKNRCVEAGFRVRCVMRGLGELPGVRKIYKRHLDACIKA